MQMAQLLRRAIGYIGDNYILSASVTVAAADMVTATAALRAAVTAKPAPAGISVAAIEVSTVEVSAIEVSAIGVSGVETAISEAMVDVSMIDVSMVDVSMVDKAAIGISAAVVFALKTSPIKATAVEISGIPSFEKRPIVGIVGVIPIVAIPDGVVVVCISGKVSFKAYTIAVSISIIGIGIGALICRIGFLIDWRRCLVNRSGGLGIAPGGDQHAGGCQGGECKDLFHFVCDFKLAAERLFLFAHPGYKKANRPVYLTGVC
jgi:hypothetical protein